MDLCASETVNKSFAIKRLWILLRHLRQQPVIPMFSINITVHDCCWIKSHGRQSHTWLGYEQFKCWSSNENMLSPVNHSLFRFVPKSIYMLITWQHFIILFPITDKCAPFKHVYWGHRKNLITIFWAVRTTYAKLMYQTISFMHQLCGSNIGWKTCSCSYCFN